MYGLYTAYGWSIVLDVYLCEVVKRPNDQVHMAAHIHSLLWRDYLHLPVHAMWTAKLLWPVGIGLWPGFQMDSVFSWPVLTHTHTRSAAEIYIWDVNDFRLFVSMLQLATVQSTKDVMIRFLANVQGVPERAEKHRYFVIRRLRDLIFVFCIETWTICRGRINAFYD